MCGFRALWAALLLLPALAAAAGPEEAQRLLAKGLIELHAGRDEQALPLLRQAVSADPNNVDALYYRGLAFARLGRFDEAVGDLSAVLATQPDHPNAALDLGAALVQNADYEEALAPLAAARDRPELKAQALLFLGLAQLRLQRMDEARRDLAGAYAADPSLALPARYYLGVAAYQEQDWQRAREEFEAVMAIHPDSEMGREAAIFLERLDEGAPGRRPPRVIYGEIGFQYDSNVVLAPSDGGAQQDLNVSRQSDGRAVFTIGAAYAPWRDQNNDLVLGYELFQSVHFDLTEFNLQDHRPSAQLLHRHGRFGFSLLAQYDYYLLDNQPFLQEVSALPRLAIAEGSFGRTEIHYRMRMRDYRDESFDGIRDSFQHSAGPRQFFYLGSPERFFVAGYEFDREDPNHRPGDRFGYWGHQGLLGIGWPLPLSVRGDLTYVYRDESYDRASNGRHDQEHRLLVATRRSITRHLYVALAYFGTFNNSTDPAFEYDRHTVSLSVGGRF